MALGRRWAAWAGQPDMARLLEEGGYGAERAILTGSGCCRWRWRGQRRRAVWGAAVALPAFGCFDLATAAVGADVPVLFYDLEPTTLQPDLGQAWRRRSGRARAPW